MKNESQRQTNSVFGAVLVFGVLALGTGCSKGAGFRDADFEIVAVEPSAKLPKVPVVLWDDWMKTKPSAMDYGRLKAYLIEETPGVLGKKNYQVQFPQGGGELDLGDFLNSEKSGLWSLAIDVDHAEEKEASLSVFFVSHGKRRKLSGQVFGSGCGRILEVTSYFKKSMRKNGFEVSSSGARDISAIGGDFFFVVRKAEKMWLSRLTISDRYRSKYLCGESSAQ